MGGDMKYVVIGFVRHIRYASLFRIQCLTHVSCYPLHWPTVGWLIIMLHGADDIPVKIDYKLCHVPRTLNMRMEVYKTFMHMIFLDLTRLYIPSNIQPISIILCDVSDSMKMLNSSCTISVIHKALITSREYVKSTRTVTMIEQLNNEMLKYNDYNNIDSVKAIFNTNKGSLLSAHSFQKNHVKS